MSNTHKLTIFWRLVLDENTSASGVADDFDENYDWLEGRSWDVPEVTSKLFSVPILLLLFILVSILYIYSRVIRIFRKRFIFELKLNELCL